MKHQLEVRTCTPDRECGLNFKFRIKPQRLKTPFLGGGKQPQYHNIRAVYPDLAQDDLYRMLLDETDTQARRCLDDAAATASCRAKRMALLQELQGAEERRRAWEADRCAPRPRKRSFAAGCLGGGEGAATARELTPGWFEVRGEPGASYFLCGLSRTQ